MCFGNALTWSPAEGRYVLCKACNGTGRQSMTTLGILGLAAFCIGGAAATAMLLWALIN